MIKTTPYTMRKATDENEEPNTDSESLCSITVTIKAIHNTFATANTRRQVSRRSPSLSPNSPNKSKRKQQSGNYDEKAY